MSETNDADLSCFTSFGFSHGVRMLPLCGNFNRLLVSPGGGEISLLLALGKCLIPRYVPGVAGPGFQLTDAK